MAVGQFPTTIPQNVGHGSGIRYMKYTAITDKSDRLVLTYTIVP